MSNRDRITAIFPGQGGIKAGLGEEAFVKSKEARKVFFAASAEVGENIAEIAFGSETDKLADYAQMVRTAASLAEYEYARERGLRVIGAGGHSLGQLAALGALGAIELPDLFAITHTRQEAMKLSNQENPGLMVAVSGITKSMAARIAENTKTKWANINASDQHVFSGRIHIEDLHINDRVSAAVTAIREEAVQRGRKLKAIKVRPLGPETGAAHSAEQEPGVPMLAEKVYQLKDRFNHIPPGAFQANSVRWLTTPDQIAEEIISGLTEGVDWHGQTEEYFQSGYRQFYEVPSSDVLTNLFRRDYVVRIAKKRFGDTVILESPKPAEITEE
jgi:malonyl CoA-acyl carrier protein transacylase